MEYKFLKARGALNEADAGDLPRPTAVAPAGLPAGPLPRHVLELVPESVARENRILPLAFDGETLTCAAVIADDIALADRLRFLLAKNVRLVPAPREALEQAINRHYGDTKTRSVDSMLAEPSDYALAATESEEAYGEKAKGIRFRLGGPEVGRALGRRVVEFKKGLLGLEDQPRPMGGAGMFFYTVEEGQQVLMRRSDGTLEVIAGPRKVWRWGRSFRPMAHHVAYPDQFLIVHYRDGRQEHVPGPAHLWLDPRVHLEVRTQDALQLAAKEAVIVYSRPAEAAPVTRRIVNGPALFVPQPGEWLHTFSWHASRGGSRGAPKVANALVFQKLWLMPDQMYHDVADVRTADDAVLTIRLMIFFELADIGRMLDTTHDPIGDFVNAATSDVVEFTGRHTFEAFKRNTEWLNALETYRQLTGRAAQCGYRINKVVYRGYGTAEALQQMHDHAIEARTKLQLDRATEQQAQELEDYKLDSQLARAGKRRAEQAVEVGHDLELTRRRQEAELHQREAQSAAVRELRRLEGEGQLELRRRQDAAQREHLGSLRELGVDLTAYLTQARADRVIEVRGDARPHVHLDPQPANGPPNDRQA
jgi:hypothetical protein